MKKSYSVHEFIIQEGERPVILISEEENAKIEIDLPEFHIEFFMPEDILRELAEKAIEFLGEKQAETRDQAESEEVPVHAEG